MESIVNNSGYGLDDFFIYAMSGTRDFDYAAFSHQIQAMLDAPGGVFIDADNEKDGNYLPSLLWSEKSVEIYDFSINL